MWTRNKSFIASTFILSSLLLTTLFVLGPFSGNGVTYAERDQQPESVERALAHAESLSEAFQYVADTVRPSVVSIRSLKKIRAASGSRRSTPQLPEEFRRFFGEEDMFERFFEFGFPEGDRTQQGLGSGVIFSTDGYVLTNNHVVGQADQVLVTLADGREFSAEVIGTDKKTDLAVLKIKATGLTAAPLGNSDTVNVGEWVLAIGSPFNYHQTVTAGIVSAKGRTVGVAAYEDFIQTDAAINPGNSGGPLVNLRGEVIGINTAIASRSGGFNGLGFSIPSKMVRTITDAIVKHGRVQRGKLGVMVQDLNEDLAKSFQFYSSDAVLIGDVQPDSPAEEAGLQAGDIVTALNGKPVKNMRELRHSVAALAPGTRVEVGVYRDARQMTMHLVLDELEDHPQTTTVPDEESTDELGINVETLTAEIARRLRLESGLEGVIVMQVEPGSIAHRAPIRQGDVIVAVGDQPVRTVVDFRKAIEKQDLEQGVRLRVVTNGIGRFAFLHSLR